MMNRRKLSHVIAAGLLAGLVAMPGPAGARTTPTRSAVDFWSWVLRVWDQGNSQPASRCEVAEKEGHGIDPNGGTPTGGATGQSYPAYGTTLGSQSNQGLGLDPNG
jgi:hypothetical protein